MSPPTRTPSAGNLLRMTSLTGCDRRPDSASTPDKPDPARGWLHVETLLALDEAERVEKLSDADFDKEMRAKGRDPARVQSTAELLARATERAKKREGSSAKPPAPVVALR